MIFGLEQEGGSLIAPMALAHPLHPIDNRSRNKRRNLWVGRLDDVFAPDDIGSRPEALCLYIYICIPYLSFVIGRLYMYIYIYIQRECHSVLAKLHPIMLYRIVFPGLNANFCFLWFTNCVWLFDKSLILGCL